MIKAIIFDLDGTLLYTLEDLYLSCNRALKEFGLKQRTADEVKSFVGNGVEVLMRRAAEDGYSLELLEYFKRDYAVHKQDHTKVYPGIDELLKELKCLKISCAVVSNKFDAAVKELCEKYFPKVFACTVGESENVKRKPAPDTVVEAMKIMNVLPDEVLYVGDSEVDIQTAQNAGVKCISVLWGFRSEQVLLQNNAKIIVKKPSQIIDFLGE